MSEVDFCVGMVVSCTNVYVDACTHRFVGLYRLRTFQSEWEPVVSGHQVRASYEFLDSFDAHSSFHDMFSCLSAPLSSLKPAVDYFCLRSS